MHNKSDSASIYKGERRGLSLLVVLGSNLVKALFASIMANKDE